MMCKETREREMKKAVCQLGIRLRWRRYVSIIDIMYLNFHKMNKTSPTLCKGEYKLFNRKRAKKNEAHGLNESVINIASGNLCVEQKSNDFFGT